eukprot:6748330-Alexandrium_andersonii.AAC.1
MRDRGRMIDFLLEALVLDPSASDADLFETCQERGGPCAYLVTFATCKSQKLEQGLQHLEGACVSRGPPVGSFRPEPRARSWPPPP